MIRTLTLLLFLASCGRPLTENEQAFARTIMGETLNVRQARLHNGSPSRGVTMTRQARPRTTCRERILPPEKVGEVITTKPAAIALWNTVLFDKDWYLDDYLPDYPDRIGLIAAMIFSHELTHVWQWQNRAPCARRLNTPAGLIRICSISTLIPSSAISPMNNKAP